MKIKLPELNFFIHYPNYNCINVKVLNIEIFMRKFSSKNDTMKGSELQRYYNYPIYPRVSKIITDKGFINLDDGRMEATPWGCFTVKDNNFYYSDNCGGQPGKFLLKQISKPIIYHNYKM